LGRRDAQSPDDYSAFPAVEPITTLKQKFRTMGFSMEEFVALSGAHTVGTLAPNTPRAFDNAYYRALLQGQGRLPSDNGLMSDPELRMWVERFAQDEGSFFRSFERGMMTVANVNAF